MHLDVGAGPPPEAENGGQQPSAPFGPSRRLMEQDCRAAAKAELGWAGLAPLPSPQHRG
ncbi:hypothetical protein GGTG_09833 [Gaeumannomyces tritici R3-111a-1]|uniref:Uncharacterized protein n=1 Tax=Gaeumannomyces tritici (strain R3-111a-1) TaxID=644352 RepID=J3P8J9_GAET3|nr:hypothetical protein GGTG_09833 [Gaeumannomyces tritici R3-111a-1]EJT72982.1 hypothetical protein GGTG_09833 [Gaeumannomyces tritici R3-111a-1]